MARWQRALAALRRTVAAGEPVLDLGCAFGYGTRLLARHYRTDGLDASAGYIGRARRAVPEARFTVGDAARLPYADGAFAGVVLLDVLEHVGDERAVIAEVARVLRPGGTLVLSVPHSGVLRWADSLNVYAWLSGEDALAPPGTPWRPGAYHRHYSAGALSHLLGAEFQVCYVHSSGLGVAEFVHLPILLLCKRLLRSRRLYDALQYLYYGAYIAEDVLPLPHIGYHLMLVARRVIP